ncbi:uncharacterized protein [Diadema antillarum]|uniref:uncharacterized protein n=1 Tax=Diadema antillarum TaxID=105358 RepID=UPI003A880432
MSLYFPICWRSLRRHVQATLHHPTQSRLSVLTYWQHPLLTSLSIVKSSRRQSSSLPLRYLHRPAATGSLPKARLCQSISSQWPCKSSSTCLAKHSIFPGVGSQGHIGLGSVSLCSQFSSVGDIKQITTQQEKKTDRMAEGRKGDSEQEEIKYPAVDTYGPITIKGCDLQPGKRKKWCTCGLSKKAPWCDGAHKKTGFRSLKWEVPENPDSVYQICNCKYTKTPPFCDGTHTNLPEVVLARQKNCPNRANHEECVKLCTGCGWKVDF